MLGNNISDNTRVTRNHSSGAIAGKSSSSSEQQAQYNDKKVATCDTRFSTIGPEDDALHMVCKPIIERAVDVASIVGNAIFMSAKLFFTSTREEVATRTTDKLALNETDFYNIQERFKEFQDDVPTSLEGFILRGASDIATCNEKFMEEKAEQFRIYHNEIGNMKRVFGNSYSGTPADQCHAAIAIGFVAPDVSAKNYINDIQQEEDKFTAEDLKLYCKTQTILDMCHFNDQIKNNPKLQGGNQTAEILSSFMSLFLEGYDKFLSEGSPEQQQQNENLLKTGIFSLLLELPKVSHDSSIKFNMYTKIIKNLKENYQTLPAIINVLTQIDELVNKEELLHRSQGSISASTLNEEIKQLNFIDLA